MMPLAAALRTLGADLVRCDAEGMAGDDHPLDGHRGAVCEPGPAGVVPSERTAKFAADMRRGSTAHDCPTRCDFDRRAVTMVGPRDCMKGIINQEGIA